MAFALTRHFALFVTIFDIAADAERTFTKKPFLKPLIILTITRMRYGNKAVDVVSE